MLSEKQKQDLRDKGTSEAEITQASPAIIAQDYVGARQAAAEKAKLHQSQNSEANQNGLKVLGGLFALASSQKPQQAIKQGLSLIFTGAVWFGSLCTSLKNDMEDAPKRESKNKDLNPGQTNQSAAAATPSKPTQHVTGSGPSIMPEMVA